MSGITQSDAAMATAPPAKNRHRLAHHKDWPWLPTAGRGTLRRHAWCEECGAVRAVGTERALPLGGIINLLSRAEHRLRQDGIPITEAQRRLIVRAIQAREADDSFGMTRDAQIRAVSGIAATYLHVHSETIESYLRSC